MNDYLVEHARKNVWCSPRMDHQVILSAKRVSPSNGNRYDIALMWGSITLPTTSDRYHVFQIGQYSPILLGLLPIRRKWYKLSDAMVSNKLMADVYLNNGLQLPRFETWIMTTEDRAIIMAVKDQPSIASLKSRQVFLRLYSNAFFASDRSNDYDYRIEVVGHRFTSVINVLLFQQNYINHQQLPGLTSLYVNGRLVNTFLPQSLKAGDVLEFVYDSTVKQVLEFPLSQAPFFESLLDSKRKYLLSYEGDQVDGAYIDYRDDIDVYLIRKTEANRFTGVYYHKNQDDAFRQVTHRDWSVTAQYIASYVQDHLDYLSSADQVVVRLHIRKSGYARPLIFEHHRIHELYKLSYQERLMAMVGVDSGVDVWKAQNLENSDYIKIMDAHWININHELVQNAYGYNATAQLIANAPLPVEFRVGDEEVVLPYQLRQGATMYEYGSDGSLLGFYYYASGSVYHPYNADCKLVEGITGRGGYKINTVFGQNQVTLKNGVNYRFYLAPISSGGTLNNHWMDVTGDPTKYAIEGNLVTWAVDGNYWATAVKGDDEFLAYTLKLAPADGLLKFSIDAEASYPTGAAQGVMFIPPARLELWLNGNALIKDLDYYVHWPEITIINKQYLNNTDQQKIDIRAYGFCRPDMSFEPSANFGFVKYGLLSRNNRYDIRDDRVMRMVVLGKTYDRKDLKFSETDSGLYMDNVQNGAPYIIDDIIVPIREMVNIDTYTYRAQSQVVDQQVSDYLTLKLPEPVEVNPNMVPRKYWIYSPFSSVVMHHLKSGQINLAGFKGQYSDRDVRVALANYEYLLQYEPTRDANIDLDLVSIHPHNKLTEVTLDIYQYNFLRRAIKTYLDDKVDLSQFISIDQNIG